MRSKISLVISAYNEEGNINKLYQELSGEIKKAKLTDYEFIFVDDGSSDKTFDKCFQLQQKDKHVKIVRLSRNFGHEIAMTAGMDHAKGEAVLFMDADLQHPPKYIPQMIKEWQKGTDIVLTRRVDNQDTSGFYQFCAKSFYWILNHMSDTKIPEKTPDFRLIDRKYIDVLKQFKEHDRLFRGILSLFTSEKNVKVIEFVAPERFSGTSKYNFRKSFKLAFNSIVQFSTTPLRLSIYLGILGALFAIAMGIYVVVEHFILKQPSNGYATIMTTMVMLGAIQLIVLGILGEYIGKIHIEVKNRPLYSADWIERKDDKKNNKR